MTLELSGYYYPNKMAHIYVQSIEKTIGEAAMRKAFELGEIPPELYPPPNNFAKSFDFAHLAAIGTGLEKMYGWRGERGLAFHAGRAAYLEGFAEYGILLGSGELAFKAIPLKAKLKVGLRSIAEAFGKFGDQVTTIEEADDYFIYTIHRCPVCWGRKSSRSICYIAEGLLEEALKWVSGGKSFQVEEVECIAMGHKGCVFHIPKEPIE